MSGVVTYFQDGTYLTGAALNSAFSEAFAIAAGNKPNGPATLDASGNLSSQTVLPSGATAKVTLATLASNVAAFQITNIAALRALTSGTTATTASVSGYAAAADGGGGTFVVDAADTTSSDNGGTIIVDVAGRRWYRIYEDAISVKWFGAKGDGVTDDTAACQSAFDAAPALGNAVRFPASKGVYLLSSALAAPVGLNIEGDGTTASIIYQSSATEDGITYANAPSAFFTGGSVRNIAIRAATEINPTSVGSSGTGLSVQSANDNFILENVDVAGFGIGINLDGCWNSRFSNFRVFTFTTAGLQIGANSSYPITGGNRFSGALITNESNSAGSGVSTGVSLVQSAGDYFFGIEADSCAQGWVINPGSGQSVYYCTFVGCLADTNGYGWNFNAVNGTILSLVCTNCWASYNTNTGILFTGSAADLVSVRWVGGRIRENGTVGVDITGGTAIAIQDSSITANNRLGAAGANGGIGIAANVGGVTITGNTIGNYASSTLNQGSSVVISSGTGSNILVTNNMTIGTPSGGAAAIVNDSTGTNVLVTNNVGP